MKKAFMSKADVHLALLEFRNTPSERNGVSTSQKLFSRRTRTCLPTTKDLLKPRVIDAEKVVTGAEQAKEKQKENYVVKARVLVPLEKGEIVRMRLPEEQKWSLGTCIKQVGPRSYEVRCGERNYTRNRRHIRNTAEKFRDSGRPSDNAECQTFCKPIVSTSNSMTCPENPVLLRRSTRDRKTTGQVSSISKTYQALEFRI
jgi:hypothetical protein